MNGSEFPVFQLGREEALSDGNSVVDGCPSVVQFEVSVYCGGYLLLVVLVTCWGL